MLPNPNMYAHHQQYNPHGEQSWMHQQPNHQQQHQAQQAAVAAAQQQHYNRLAGAHNNAAQAQMNAASHAQENGLENVSEDNRRTLTYVADLLNENTREAALLELSKKREQVPELALILWHSFGMFYCIHTTSGQAWLTYHVCNRCYDFPYAGDHFRLHPSQPLPAYCGGFEPSLQRIGPATVCSISQRYAHSVSQRYVHS